MSRLVQGTGGTLAGLGLVAIGLALIPGHASATGFTDVGQDLELHDDWAVELDGYLRLRGEVLGNLDLDRGLSPSGQALFPVPIDDPGAQVLYEADMRLRTDLAFYAPGHSIAVKVRLDTFDNLTFGSTPDGAPSSTTTQRSLDAPFRLRRAYGEVLTPIGLLAAGRMGNHWGLGMLANGGDCSSCDSGDSADRVAFITPMAGHIWAFAFDIASSGPVVPRRSGFRAVDIAPSDDVRGVTLAFLRWHGDEARERRHRAGRATIEYGAYGSFRWQDSDVPAWYLPIADQVELNSAQVVPRGLSALAVDGWARFQTSEARIELEAAFLWAEIQQATLTPGVLFRDRVTSMQFGAALETDFGDLDGEFSAAGFGAFPAVGQPATQPGDIDGPQAAIPTDTTVDNFRFHPDYRIDRILFRELIGTVTDAFYFRPHVRWRILNFSGGTLTANLFAVASFAVQSSSTPGGESPLGIEIDPGLTYQTPDGFFASLEYAALFPLAGLDNPAMGLRAQPAQLLRLRLMYGF